MLSSKQEDYRVARKDNNIQHTEELWPNDPDRQNSQPDGQI